MVERRDDLDLVYECPAGRYVYPTTLVRGQATASCYKPACRKEKKKLEKSSQTQLPSTCMCGGESQGRDLSRFFFLSLQIMYPTLTLPYLTVPYLTYATYATYATYRSKKQEASPKNRCTQTATRRGRRGRGRWGGAEKPSSKGSVVPPKYLGSLFKKIRCTILPTWRYGTFYQVKLYLLSLPISFARSMHLSLFFSLSLALGRYLLPTQPNL